MSRSARTGSVWKVALLMSLAFAVAGTVRANWLRYSANQRPVLECPTDNRSSGMTRVSAQTQQTANANRHWQLNQDRSPPASP